MRYGYLTLILFSAKMAVAQVPSLLPSGSTAVLKEIVPGFPIRSTTEVTVGTNGVVARTTAQGAAGSLDPTISSGISGIPYPTRLEVIMIDVTTNDTLACASVQVQGLDQWGRAISETLTTITETAQNTVRAYSTVTRVVGTDCGGGTEAGDYLRISTSAAVAIPIKIRSYTEIHSACFVDSSASNNVICYSGADLNSAGAVYTTVVSGGRRIDSYVIDMVDAQLATAIADGDSLILRVFVRNSLATP